MGRDSIIMRVENIGDTFDSEGVILEQEVQLLNLANRLFTLVNGLDYSFSAEVKELSLTANQSIEEMTANKIQWATVDDQVTSTNESRSSADSIDSILLQQQRIRVFSVIYTVSNSAFL